MPAFKIIMNKKNSLMNILLNVGNNLYILNSTMNRYWFTFNVNNTYIFLLIFKVYKAIHVHVYPAHAVNTFVVWILEKNATCKIPVWKKYVYFLKEWHNNTGNNFVRLILCRSRPIACIILNRSFTHFVFQELRKLT
jgi:hypothetical protein